MRHPLRQAFGRIAVATMIVAVAVTLPIGRPTPAKAAFVQVNMVPIAPVAPPVPSARTDLDCPTVLKCYAADGALSRTEDGGATWTPVDIPLQWSATEVECWDAVQCAVGFSGPLPGDDWVRWTVDGGATWEARGASSVRTAALSCPTPLLCVAVDQTEMGAAAGSWASMTTYDGGLTWTTTLTIESLFDPVAECTVSGLCVVAGLLVVYRSSDFGATWTELAPVSAAASLDCPAADRCVVWGASREVLITATEVVTSSYNGTVSSRATSCPTPTSCVHASDLDNDVLVARRPLPVEGFTQLDLGSVVAGDARVVALDCLGVTCTMLLRSTATPLIDSGVAWVLRSVDGGDSWSTATADSLSAAVPRAIACTASRCVMGGSAGVGGEFVPHGFLATSADGGSTWDPVALPAGALEVVALGCTSTGLCVAARPGLPGGFSVTLDHGVSWTEVTSAVDMYRAPDVACTGDTCMVVMGEGGTLVWTTASAAPTVSAAIGGIWPSVGCMSESACLLSMVDPFTPVTTLYRTTDRGATWLPFDTRGRVVGCWSTGCVVTTYAGTHLTRDLGATLEQISGMSDVPLDVDCQGDDCIMVTDGLESVWTSANGGDSWHAVRPDFRLRDVDCSGSSCVGLTLNHVVRLDLAEVSSPPISIHGPATALQPAVRLR